MAVIKKGAGVGRPFLTVMACFIPPFRLKWWSQGGAASFDRRGADEAVPEIDREPVTGPCDRREEICFS